MGQAEPDPIRLEGRNDGDIRRTPPLNLCYILYMKDPAGFWNKYLVKCSFCGNLVERDIDRSFATCFDCKKKKKGQYGKERNNRKDGEDDKKDLPKVIMEEDINTKDEKGE